MWRKHREEIALLNERIDELENRLSALCNYTGALEEQIETTINGMVRKAIIMRADKGHYAQLETSFVEGCTEKIKEMLKKK